MSQVCITWITLITIYLWATFVLHYGPDNIMNHFLFNIVNQDGPGIIMVRSTDNIQTLSILSHL